MIWGKPTQPTDAAEPSGGVAGPAPYPSPDPYAPYVPYGATWAPVPPRPGGTFGRWLFAIMSLVLVVVVAGVTGVLGIATYTGLLDREGRWVGTAAEKVNGAPARPEAQSPAPPANADASTWQGWVAARGADILSARSRALQANDEKAFLASIDPAAKSLVTEQRRRFRLLRTLRMADYREKVDDWPKAKGARSWEMTISTHYCVVEAGCLAAPQLPMGSTWTFRNGTLLITKINLSGEEWNGPRPWEVNDLVVKEGKRVIVATTRANVARLDSAARAADRAAAVADVFAGFRHKAPSRYVIYLAGPAEWRRWYGGTGENWAAARAWPVSDYASEVVIRVDSVRPSEMENLLRHELTHVSSLAGAQLTGDQEDWWWLLEGIAEYASYRGRSVATYDALGATRRFINNRSKWDGHMNISPPRESATLEEAAARYGIAFLCVRRVADKYGERRMLKFFNGVLQEGRKLDDAAESALGVSWSTVDSDCARYVRDAVNS